MRVGRSQGPTGHHREPPQKISKELKRSSSITTEAALQAKFSPTSRSRSPVSSKAPGAIKPKRVALQFFQGSSSKMHRAIATTQKVAKQMRFSPTSRSKSAISLTARDKSSQAKQSRVAQRSLQRSFSGMQRGIDDTQKVVGRKGFVERPPNLKKLVTQLKEHSIQRTSSSNKANATAQPVLNRLIKH